MIELTRQSVDSANTIVELRNKVLNLTRSVGFCEEDAVRISTRFSQLARQLLEMRAGGEVIIGFIKLNGHYQLLIRLQAECDIFEFKTLPMLFKHTDTGKEGKNHSYLDIFEAIEDESFRPRDDKLQELREILIRQSKAELMSEVQRKNEELSKLLEDLKRSSGLIQSEKMRALGTLTAGVAHELNNPMMGIINFIQYCIKHTDEDDKRYEPLKDAEREVKRCVEIVRNLLTFSHQENEGTEQFKDLSINTVVERVIKILSYRLRAEKIEVTQELSDDLPIIMGQENRLQQIVLNIVGNAIDAMKDKETRQLTISTEATENAVLIKIKDSGGGMDEETIEQIFEPFFTTKPTGSGTGLGLSVCESIIKEHNGQLHCDSQLGSGTTFTISLPLQQEGDAQGEKIEPFYERNEEFESGKFKGESHD